MSEHSTLIRDLIEKMVGPLCACEMDLLLQEPEQLDDRVHRLKECFAKHPHFETSFHALVGSMHEAQLNAPIDEQIRFYTTKHTRSWLLVNLLNEVLQIKELSLDPSTGRLPAPPQALLPYAHQACTVFGEESRYKNFSLASGLLFDYLFYLQKTPGFDLTGIPFEELLKTAFSESLKQGKLISQLAKHKSKLSLETASPFTAFARNLAPLILILLKPAQAFPFYKELATEGVSENLRSAKEAKEFGAETGLVPCLFVQSFSLFNQLGEAMSIWGNPYLSWSHGHRDIHDLSSIGLLGVELALRLRAQDFPDEAQVSELLPELKFFDFKINLEVKNEIKI